VVLGLSLVAGKLREVPTEGYVAADRPKVAGPRLHELVPWFIIGFLLVAAARSLGLIPQPFLIPLASAASVLTTVSMAALGLGVDVRIVAKAGARVTLAVTICLVVLGVISFCLIRLVAVP
jgi:uncharacterized membrane protein YadS